MAVASSRTMLAPQVIKSFVDDFDLARKSYATASVYLEFEQQHHESAEGLKRTWLAAYECGGALKRMHDSKSYFENYGTWGEVCEAVHVSRKHADRLMRCSVILGTLPQELIGQLGMPLSFRQVETIGEASDEQREQFVEEVREAVANPNPTPDEGDAAFSRLRETLKSMSANSKNKSVVEAVAGNAKPAKEKGVEWAVKQAKSLRDWFSGRGDEESASHLEAVLQQLQASPM